VEVKEEEQPEEEQPRLTSITKAEITTADDLRSNLQTRGIQHFRIFILEDLSQQVIEAFGARFRIDPSFFRAHIDDYAHSKLWKGWNTTARLFYNHKRQAPNLSAHTRRRKWFSVRNVRLCHHDDKKSSGRHEEGLNSFNVLRRCDGDMDTAQSVDAGSVCLSITQTRTTVWIGRDRKSDGIPIGLVIVDPTVGEGHQIWDDRANWMPIPKFKSSTSHLSRSED
jgi:hypothetical protein